MGVAAALIVGGLAAGVGGALLSKGKKPKIPKYQPINVGNVQAEAIQGNIRSFKDAAALATQTNEFNQEALTALINKSFPGAKDKIEQNITSQLKGELPQDVVNQIRRSSAQRAVAGGFSGSGFSNNLTARDLGLTSLQLTQQGINSAQRWLQQSTAPLFDVSSMFVRPEFAVGAALNQQSMALNQNNLRAQANAMPDPTKAALGGFLSQAGGIALGAGLGNAFGAMGAGAGASTGAGASRSQFTLGQWQQTNRMRTEAGLPY